jgi:hypothetical protein
MKQFIAGTILGLVLGTAVTARAEISDFHLVGLTALATANYLLKSGAHGPDRALMISSCIRNPQRETFFEEATDLIKAGQWQESIEMFVRCGFGYTK